MPTKQPKRVLNCFKIRSLLAARGERQNHLAALLDVSAAFISVALSGRPVAEEIVARIARHFGTSAELISIPAPRFDLLDGAL